MLALRYFYLILALLLAILAGATNYFSVFRSLNLSLYDSVQSVNTISAADDILIVEVDEQSIEALGAWPWSRSHHAQLLERLSELGARYVAFDIVFPEVNPGDVLGDTLFAEAIKTHGGVVLPIFFGKKSNKSTVLEVPPAQIFYEAEPEIGHVHLSCEEGVCRSVFLKEGVGQPFWPHISLALLEFQNKQNASSKGVDSFEPDSLPGARAGIKEHYSPQIIYRDYHNLIAFPEPNNNYQTASYLDIISGRFPKDSFKGFTVFVGATAAALGDEIASPAGPLPGVVVNAAVYQQLRSETLIAQVPRWATACFIAVFGFLLLLTLSRLPPLYFLMGTLCALMMSYFTVLLLLTIWKVWLPIASFSLMIMIYYPLWSWFKTQLALNYLKVQLNKLNAETFKSTTVFSKSDVVKEKDAIGVEVVTDTLRRLDSLSVIVEEHRFMIENTLGRLQEAVILATENGDIVLANERAKSIFALKEASVLSDIGRDIELKFVSDRPATDEQSAWNAYIHALIQSSYEQEKEASQSTNQSPKQNAHLGVEVALRRADGYRNDFAHESIATTMYCRSAIREFDAPTGESYKMLILTFTDITALKFVERSKMDTLNFLSHDLRSPMVSVLALIANVQAGRNTESFSDNLLKIKAYAEKNLSYSESILQLSRAEGINSDKFTHVDLHSVLDSAYFNVLDYAESKNMTITIEREDEDFWVFGDSDLLERALQNLLTNAIKYNRPGDTVTLSIGLSGDDVMLCVKDNGIGISKDEIDVIFERYKRGKSDGQHNSGAGLGLYFVKTVMHKHSGTISIESVVDKGSCFTLSLPRI